MKVLSDFLTTKTDRAKLENALSVIREFKSYEGDEEWLATPFIAWIKLEQLEEYLDYLVNNVPLEADTMQYLKENDILHYLKT